MSQSMLSKKALDVEIEYQVVAPRGILMGTKTVIASVVARGFSQSANSTAFFSAKALAALWDSALNPASLCWHSLAETANSQKTL